LKRIFMILGLCMALCLPMAAASFPVTSPFGWRVHPVTGEWKFHTGVDLGYDYGAGIVALFDGQVIQSGDFGDGYGNQVLVYHAAIDAYTRYAHCSTIYVQAGEQVYAGEVIAAVGSSGNATGPHLHLEYMPRSGDGYVYTDPLILWQ